ncbi:MAG: hypothetical protein U9R75_08470 [Candidatus Thermoplasmatota archaeon]|nr:hypothetical protein [Candidatus Thermoplasmatota archaeon]
MAGNSVSELIFFIAAILVSSAVAISLIEVIDSYSDEISDQASLLNVEMGSSIEIINDPMYVNYNTTSSNLTYYLKNVGSRDLSLDDIVVSANGTARSGSNITAVLMGGGSGWSSGDVVEVTFNVPGLRSGLDYPGWASTSGMTEKKIVKGNAQDTIVFRIWGV